MLDGYPPILSREHRWFFAITSAGLLIRAVELVLALAFPQPKDGISFAVYSIFDLRELMSPVYCVTAFVVCIPLAWKLRVDTLIPSLFSLALLTYFFDYWFVDTQFRISSAAAVNPDFEFKTFDFILLAGSLFDVITFVLVNVLSVWQVSLIDRLYRFSN